MSPRLLNPSYTIISLPPSLPGSHPNSLVLSCPVKKTLVLCPQTASTPVTLSSLTFSPPSQMPRSPGLHISRVMSSHNTSCLFSRFEKWSLFNLWKDLTHLFFFPEMPSLSYRPKACLWHSLSSSFKPSLINPKLIGVLICLSFTPPPAKNVLTLNGSVLDTAKYCSHFICYRVVINSTVIRCIILH